MEALDVVARADAFVRTRLAGEPTGHDWHHSRRVAAVAARLARAEGADETVCALAGMLHDVADRKVDDGTGMAAVAAWLGTALDPTLADKVRTVLGTVAYRHPLPDETVSLEAACVHDADKLEWIGALGIARTFAYGGSIGRMIRDDDPTNVTTYAHCRDRLVGVDIAMRTATGRSMAKPRQQFVEQFLERFDAEWSVTAD